MPSDVLILVGGRLSLTLVERRLFLILVGGRLSHVLMVESVAGHALLLLECQL